MKKGDLLLVKFRFDPIGWIIRKATNCNYNHIAWILNKDYIIETRGRGIRINPIQRYNNKFLYKTKVLKLKGITQFKLKKALSYALINVSKGNYFKLLITYFMIFCKYQGKQPRYSCSGLIAECLSKVNFYFNKRKKPQNITPADIEKSNRTYENGFSNN